MDTNIHRIFAPLEKEGPPNIRELKKQALTPQLDEKIKGLFPSQVEDTGMGNINFFIRSKEDKERNKETTPPEKPLSNEINSSEE